jgi:hypothetical protein
MKLRIAVVAIGLGALAGAPASAAVAPAPSHMPKPSAVINTSALGTVAPGGQNLTTSNVEQVRRRGGRGFRRGGRSFRGRSLRGGRGFRGRAFRRGRAWRGGRGYRGRIFRGSRGFYGGRYHRRGWRSGRRWYGGRWIGPAIVAGTAALILGGSIANSQSAYHGNWERCDDRFRSFRWSDGTYQPYGDRPRRLCPYLRR